MPAFFSQTPTLVRTIDTTQFGSSDPAGLTYIPGATPGTGRIILVDSEIDERPFFRLKNLFSLSETGKFLSSSDLVSGVTREPTGVAYDPTSKRLYISDDDQHGIYVVAASDPSKRLGFIDMSSVSSDTEDPVYDPTTGHLLILEGGGGMNPRKVYEVTTAGEILRSIQLPKAVADVEALAYDSVNNVFYASGGTSPNIYVVSRDGTTVLDTITVLAGLTNPISGIAVAPKGLILAPSSDPNDDPSVMSLWVADYGRDQVMDGRLFEIKLGGSTTPPDGGTGGGSGTGTTDVTLTDGADSFLASSDENFKVAGLGGNDTIATRGGNDTITGGAGNDTISSGDGNDTILYGSGNNGYDAVDGGAGTDDRIVVTANSVTVGLSSLAGVEVIDASGFTGTKIAGGSSADFFDFSAMQLLGIHKIDTGAGNDTVIGSAGADDIRGGSGRDLLTGGGGDDIFDFNSTSHSKGSSTDRITDFTQGSDVIDLTSIDANTRLSGNNEFVFIGDSAFGNVAGQLRYDATSLPGVTRVLADTNGDGAIDMEIHLSGTHALTQNDFLL